MWAFNELSRERDPIEISDRKRITVPRIAYRAIREWAEFRGVAHDFETMEELFVLVRALDTVWVDVETKRLKKVIK